MASIYFLARLFRCKIYFSSIFVQTLLVLNKKLDAFWTKKWSFQESKIKQVSFCIFGGLLWIKYCMVQNPLAKCFFFCWIWKCTHPRIIYRNKKYHICTNIGEQWTYVNVFVNIYRIGIKKVSTRTTIYFHEWCAGVLFCVFFFRKIFRCQVHVGVCKHTDPGWALTFRRDLCLAKVGVGWTGFEKCTANCIHCTGHVSQTKLGHVMGYVNRGKLH